MISLIFAIVAALLIFSLLRKFIVPAVILLAVIFCVAQIEDHATTDAQMEASP